MLKKLFLPLVSVVALSTQLSSTTVTTVAAGAVLFAATPAYACDLGDPYFDPIQGLIDPCEGQRLKFPDAIISCSVEEGTIDMCDASDEHCTGDDWITIEGPTIIEIKHQSCLDLGGTVLK